MKIDRHDRKILEVLQGDGRISNQELAAWTTVASMILNLDETITKQ